MQGLLPFDRSHLGPDIVAGITLAALGIPEVMGYTKIIGTPVISPKSFGDADSFHGPTQTCCSVCGLSAAGEAANLGVQVSATRSITRSRSLHQGAKLSPLVEAWFFSTTVTLSKLNVPRW
jgi:hypothetical protein